MYNLIIQGDIMISDVLNSEMACEVFLSIFNNKNNKQPKTANDIIKETGYKKSNLSPVLKALSSSIGKPLIQIEDDSISRNRKWVVKDENLSELIRIGTEVKYFKAKTFSTTKQYSYFSNLMRKYLGKISNSPFYREEKWRKLNAPDAPKSFIQKVNLNIIADGFLEYYLTKDGHKLLPKNKSPFMEAVNLRYYKPVDYKSEEVRR